ncbi:MAG TPA: hypothetical protein VLB46_17190 [Pyrinomonadaceae bacterium]|nr:hypothetical protein [Pyrinomonadaceae bacterium]
MRMFNFDEPLDLSDHMLSTYQTLRVVLVVIALVFPWLLWIGAFYVSRQRVELQSSISAYYHANEMTRKELAERASAASEGRTRENVLIDSGRGVMRNWFVGVLFAISALLAVYKGFRPAEDLALNLAAVFATLVAIFPNRWVDDPKPPFPFHGTFAILFFLCIAYVCIVCAPATLSLVKDAGRRAHYRRFYKTIGWTMVASPVLASVLTQVFNLKASYIFFAEAFGVYAFAAYWLVKTIEIRETNADRKAANGELQLAPGTGAADAVRDIPVIQAPSSASV